MFHLTEPAVFELRAGRMTLIEVAPGVDHRCDVLDRVDFVPEIVGPAEDMPAEIFQAHIGMAGGLAAKVDLISSEARTGAFPAPARQRKEDHAR
jgi:propionate CoA-transferase